MWEVMPGCHAGVELVANPSIIFMDEPTSGALPGLSREGVKGSAPLQQLTACKGCGGPYLGLETATWWPGVDRPERDGR